MKLDPLRFIAICLLLASSATRAELPMKPFAADFKLYASGIPVGKATIALEALGHCEYAMSSRLEATGLASLIYPDVIEEHARGTFNEHGVPMPAAYRHSQVGGSQDHIVEAEFSWSDMRASTRHDDKRRSIKLWRRVVDPLSLFALAMSDLQRGIKSKQYNLVHKAYRRSYRITHHEDEVLNTPLGDLRTARVSRRRSGSDRVTTFWLAADLDYLPVKVVQTRGGSEYLRMNIRSVQR